MKNMPDVLPVSDLQHATMQSSHDDLDTERDEHLSKSTIKN